VILTEPTLPEREVLAAQESEAAPAEPVTTDIPEQRDPEPAPEAQKAATPIMVPLPRGKTKRSRAKT
jgi:hypothetical protein